MEPSQFGRYELKRQVGEGGMAMVYLAYDPRFRRDVAIKVLPSEYGTDYKLRERFDREAQTIAALEHSAIVPVYDYGEDNGQPYLVMRYMPGGTLSDRIQQGPLSLSEAVAILMRIGSALESAHRKGMVHRDIKPSNILFDEHGDAYLSDFGIVRLNEDTGGLTGRSVIGTPAYLAPEIAQPGGVSPLLDIYALGVTFYEMLAGELPFQADTPMGLITAHMGKPIPDIREKRPDLPESVQAFIEQTMAKDPTDRTPSAHQLVAHLQALIGEGLHDNRPGYTPTVEMDGADLPMPTRRDSTMRPRRTKALPSKPAQDRSGTWLILGGIVATVLFVVLIGLLVLSIFRNNPRLGATSATQTPTTLPATTQAPPPTTTPITPTEPPPTNTLNPTDFPPTEPPAPPDSPTISNIVFCDQRCGMGAIVLDEFPPDTTDVFVALEFSGFRKGLFYTREWMNRGEVWSHYNCVWDGEESGEMEIHLFDAGGLRAGDWIMTIAVEGEVIARASVQINGDNEFWDPIGVAPSCPDF